MRIRIPANVIKETPKGKVELKWSPNFQGRWEGRFAMAQAFVDSEVLRQAESYTPFQEGNLVRSGARGTAVGSGEVVWNAPYARYLYYGKVMIGMAPKTLTDRNLQFNGAPKRGAFWFERMWRDKKALVLSGARKIIRGGGA